MADLTGEKSYPLEYPKEAVRVLNAMSFSNGKNVLIVGSSALKTTQYAGDFDANEVVQRNDKTDAQALLALVKEFKRIILKLASMPRVYIGDIKSGIREDWKATSPAKVRALYKGRIITSEEARDALKLMRDKSPVGKLKVAQEVKFHIIRWTPAEILRGKKTIRDGTVMYLEEAFNSPTITKLDVISLVDSRYTELSIIYQFKNHNKVLNPSDEDVEQSLKDSIKLYEAEGNRFKVIKRKFSLAKLMDSPDLKKFYDIINSEAGKIYVVYSDVKTLIDLLENHSIPRSVVQEAINGFKARLSRVYSHDYHLRTSIPLLSDLTKASTSANPLPILRNTEAQLLKLLNEQTSLRGGYVPYTI